MWLTLFSGQHPALRRRPGDAVDAVLRGGAPQLCARPGEEFLCAVRQRRVAPTQNAAVFQAFDRADDAGNDTVVQPLRLQRSYRFLLLHHVTSHQEVTGATGYHRRGRLSRPLLGSLRLSRPSRKRPRQIFSSVPKPFHRDQQRRSESHSHHKPARLSIVPGDS